MKVHSRIVQVVAALLIALGIMAGTSVRTMSVSAAPPNSVQSAPGDKFPDPELPRRHCQCH